MQIKLFKLFINMEMKSDREKEKETEEERERICAQGAFEWFVSTSSHK